MPSPLLGDKPRLSDAAWVARYSLRAAFHIARARMTFDRVSPADLIARNRSAAIHQRTTHATLPHEIARIAYVIPRIAKRVPWRSDCLVQAIAAQDWLSNLGQSSEVCIGVEQPESRDFGAHAWLISQGKIITGGDISGYEAILADTGHA